MTRSVTSLEASLATSRDLLADKQRALAARIKELDSKTEQCERIEQLLDASKEKVHQSQTSLARAEQLVSEKDRLLDERSRQVVQLEADNTELRTNLVSLSARLKETTLQLNRVSSDRKQLQYELERTARSTEQLRAELKVSRDLVNKYQDERQLNRDHSVAPRHAPAQPTALNAGKLFDVQVKHEKSSRCNVSPARQQVAETQRSSASTGRQVSYLSSLHDVLDSF